jgi:hypothetical protein
MPPAAAAAVESTKHGHGETTLLVGIAMAIRPRIDAVLVEYLAQWNAIEPNSGTSVRIRHELFTLTTTTIHYDESNRRQLFIIITATAPT